MTDVPVNGNRKRDLHPDPDASAAASSPHAGGSRSLHADPHVWIREQRIASSADVKVPERLIDQVLGQEEAVAVVKKAAEQKRNLLLIGEPGTGKSMIAKAMAEMLPEEKQSDVIVYHNNKNPNNPKVMVAEGGLGKKIIQKYDRKASKKILAWQVFEWTAGLGMIGFGLFMWLALSEGILAFLFSTMIALLFLYFSGQKRPKKEFLVPKLLVEHKAEAEKAPYVDGTGAHAGALLGDVRHDPYQSGGLETPPHARVEEGAIHRAHKGVLFIDEINVLRLPSQQALLTAMQERKFSIVGQSQNSSGAMIKTEPVPCDFILVAAGNLDAVAPPDQNHAGGMHPALRSRIRGYGYEVYVNALMDDSHENRLKLVQFVAQEVVRDGRIPHFDSGGIAELIREAQRRSGRTGKLTLRLRELGGLVRTAGDFARSAGASLVTVEHVREAKRSSRSLEQQIMEKEIENATLGEAILQTTGRAVGVANAVAAIGTGEVGEPAGLVVPVEAAVVPPLSRHGGAILMGPGLKGVAGSGVENVGPVLKILKGDKIADHDIHVDASFAVDAATGEGIGMAAAVAAVSALELLPVRQDCVLIGDVAVNGVLRPVRATLQRIEAAALRGYKVALVPASIKSSLLVDDHIRARIQIVYCESLIELLGHALEGDEAAMLGLKGRLSDTVRP
jgi:Lon-like ATP-dependent protease